MPFAMSPIMKDKKASVKDAFDPVLSAVTDRTKPGLHLKDLQTPAKPVSHPVKVEDKYFERRWFQFWRKSPRCLD